MTSKQARKMRNGEIDFFRFVFSLIIVLLHFGMKFGNQIFVRGYIGVEFFFVVTGFLMAGHAAGMRRKSNDPGVIADETWRYLLKKVRSFYPYYISAMLIQIVIRFIFVRHIGLAEFANRSLRSIPIVTLTYMGLARGGTNDFYVGNTWFLSAMLFAVFFLYPVLLFNYRFATQIIFPFLAIFLPGYIYMTNGVIALKWEAWNGVVFFGILRAVSELALGGLLFRISELTAARKPRILYSAHPLLKILVTMFKYCCYAVVILFAHGSAFGIPLKEGLDLYVLQFCSIGILLSFLSCGYCIPDSRFTRFLGEISMPVFIYHGFIRLTLWDYLHHPVSSPFFAAMVLASIIISIGLKYLTDFITFLPKIFSKMDRQETSYNKKTRRS